MKRDDITRIFEGATEEQISAVLDINSADIGKAKKNLETERDGLRTQLKDVQDALKEFEGVDVKELQGKVKTLQDDLTAKEADYKNKLSEIEFDNVLNAAISESGAKDVSIVRNALDIKALRESNNRSEDIKAALAKAKTDYDYLFNSAEPFENPVSKTTPPPQSKTMEDLSKMSYADYKAYRQNN